MRPACRLARKPLTASRQAVRPVRFTPVYVYAYTPRVEYEWDFVKASSNLRKHGVDFADAVTAFGDPLAARRDDEHSSEDRYVLIGVDANDCLLVICFAIRGDRVRIISARKASPHERRQYEDES